jgi:hypothetical protein
MKKTEVSTMTSVYKHGKLLDKFIQIILNQRKVNSPRQKLFIKLSSYLFHKTAKTIKKFHFSFTRFFYLIFYKGNKFYCSFCNHSFSKFLPTGLNLKVFKEMNIIGGGYRENSICPFCLSSDRERLIQLYIEKQRLLRKNMNLLHVAPEKNLKKFLEKKV